MGATVPEGSAFWLADAMSDQLVNGLNAIEPYWPFSTFVAYTRCRPLWTTLVKSLSDVHPDRGWASGPEDVHRYVDGSAHPPGEVGVGVGVVVGSPPPTRTSCHCWLPPFQSAYCTTFAPSAVDAPWISTALPLWRAMSWM